MIGEISFGGVYMPAPLAMGIAALCVTAALSRLLLILGAYRLFAFRPLVDLAIFAIVYGAILNTFSFPGFAP